MLLDASNAAAIIQTATCVTPTTPQTCAPPVNTALPICKLSQTGCMDATNITAFNASAIPYEVNSPLWSECTRWGRSSTGTRPFTGAVWAAPPVAITGVGIS